MDKINLRAIVTRKVSDPKNPMPYLHDRFTYLSLQHFEGIRIVLEGPYNKYIYFSNQRPNPSDTPELNKRYHYYWQIEVEPGFHSFDLIALGMACVADNCSDTLCLLIYKGVTYTFFDDATLKQLVLQLPRK